MYCPGMYWTKLYLYELINGKAQVHLYTEDGLYFTKYINTAHEKKYFWNEAAYNIVWDSDILIYYQIFQPW